MTHTSLLIKQLRTEMQYRNYSPSTVKTYVHLLENFQKSISVALDKADTDMLKSYLQKKIEQDDISTSMINQLISAYKILQVDILKRSWETVKLKRPRRNKKLPVVLSLAEIESLFNATKNIKHKALLMLTYSAGLRRKELQFIKPSAIDPGRMQIHVVQGKGKKDRFTILSPKILEYLRFYFKTERPKVYLFESQVKKGQYLSEQTLNSIIKKSAEKAGIKKKVSFHTLRHCFATHLLEQGVSLRLIQAYLGHSSIRTTSVYLHLANTNPAFVTSPLDKMNV